ncbi:hypothetical protein GCM10011320_21100 [Neoroseomonas lacus]|uniref:Uncharacterized protein n=1 Tax=Neoroseomonas lacus TaxID=287609 RepID=A0A917KI03_9PROT|nr:hypothetical protein GCM10011320_21100 [Neoroseomonas lacus]
MSASAPAGSASRKTGSIEAACTRETMTGDGSRLVIIHPAPVFWTQRPILAARLAHQSRRKAEWRRGAKAAGIVANWQKPVATGTASARWPVTASLG